MLKDCLKTVCRENGVFFETKEPRDLGLSKCPGCRARFNSSTIDNHIHSCKHLSDSQRARAVPELCGPDIRIQLRGDSNPTLVDVTVVDPCAPSHIGKPPSRLFAEVAARKDAAYRSAVTASGARFLTLAVSAQGALSDVTLAFAKELFGGASVSGSVASVSLAAATLAGSARTIMNAEAFFVGCVDGGTPWATKQHVPVKIAAKQELEEKRARRALFAARVQDATRKIGFRR